jgi:FkbM family methyltransferase
MIVVNLIDDDLPVLVDDRTAEMGGSFYYSPLRPYSPAPLKWAWEQLSRYAQATLIDVGAHTGCYTLLAKHHPDLTVHAFEPVPLTAEVLLENVHLNDLDERVTVNQMGVSSYNGLGVLNAVRSPAGSGISMVNGTPAHHKDIIESPVKVITIDDYVALNQIKPTLIKCDVEGSELFVLRGAKRTIKEYTPFLLLEYSQENTNQYGYAANEIVKFIESMGYVWTSPEGTDLLCVHLEWAKIGQFQQVKGED